MSANSKCFSWEQISSELGDHIIFAEEVINRYEWSAEMRQELMAQLEQIRAKQQDQSLNISVIGEFSSGKSTFINALLRMELLSAGVLQGTTVASTVMEYGEEYGFTVKHLSGQETTVCAASFEELKARLSVIVAENEAAQAYAGVTVRVPSQSLRENNFRIIDTPGLDAMTQWHEEVTKRTLQEVSDLSIILVDAVRPLPDSLCEFIAEHLQPILEQCVFVVTKLDLIPPRERKMLLRYVTQTAQVRFQLDSPLVLPYASLEVLNHFYPGSYENMRYEQNPEVSLASEASIMEHTARQRALVQARRLFKLTDRIYQDISLQMQNLTVGYQERLDLLYRTRQADLSDFIAQQKHISKNNFDVFMKEVYTRLLTTINLLPRQALDGIYLSIDGQNSNDQLNAYVNRQLGADCQYQAGLMCNKIRGLLLDSGAVTAVFNRVLFGYRAAFRKQFRQLACLPPEPGHDAAVAPQMPAIQLISFQDASAYTQQAVSQKSRRTWGSTAAGAAAGSVIPGVGTLVGAAIGFVSGVMMSPKIEKVRADIKEQLTPHLTQYFNGVAIHLKNQIDLCIKKTRDQLDGEIDRYLTVYQNTVDGWILEEQNRRAALEARVAAIREDMALMDQRKEQLDAVRNLLQPQVTD